MLRARNRTSSAEEALLRQACEQLPESPASDIFVTRVMASIEVTGQESADIPGFLSIRRDEVLGVFMGLSAGFILAFAAAWSLNHDSDAMRTGGALDPAIVHVVEHPFERFIWPDFRARGSDQGNP